VEEKMLDRKVVEEFLDSEFQHSDIEIPADIPKTTLSKLFVFIQKMIYTNGYRIMSNLSSIITTLTGIGLKIESNIMSSP
jgi:hypothetical protein